MSDVPRSLIPLVCTLCHSAPWTRSDDGSKHWIIPYGGRGDGVPHSLAVACVEWILRRADEEERRVKPKPDAPPVEAKKLGG